MPLYLIERRFAEQLDLTDEAVNAIQAVNADVGVHWLFSFLSADKLQWYCLFEAPSPAALQAASGWANLPVEAIIEVDRLDPSAFVSS
jgi:hypothetical protein